MKFIKIIIIITVITVIFLRQAQAQTCQPGRQEATGLVSSGQDRGISNFGNPEGRCVADDKAFYVSYNFEDYDSYADLKSIYYTQSTSADKVETTGPIGESQLEGYLNSGKKLIHVAGNSGNLGINNTITGSNTAVVFIDGNLNFNQPLNRFTYGDTNSGIVFVVQGDVNIDPNVVEINAVIITEGTICTASQAGICPTNFVPTSQLTIKGSLISLNKAKKIQFKRTLADNRNAAEKIDHQPKYLVILRNLFASPLQKWSEIQ